jgi:hypothetical protein
MKKHTKQLTEALDSIGIKFTERENDCISLTASTENYIDYEDGQKSLLIVAYVDYEEKFVRLYAPNIMNLRDSEHIDKVSQLLLWMNYRKDLTRFELDLTDQEVRCSVTIPFGEEFVTPELLQDNLNSLIRAIDNPWETIEEALKTGKLPDALYEKRERFELADLIHAAGGVEGLREILSERGLIN